VAKLIIFLSGRKEVIGRSGDREIGKPILGVGEVAARCADIGDRGIGTSETYAKLGSVGMQWDTKGGG
jgi:hypothetical protein